MTMNEQERQAIVDASIDAIAPLLGKHVTIEMFDEALGKIADIAIEKLSELRKPSENLVLVQQIESILREGWRDVYKGHNKTAREIAELVPFSPITQDDFDTMKGNLETNIEMAELEADELSNKTLAFGEYVATHGYNFCDKHWHEGAHVDWNKWYHWGNFKNGVGVTKWETGEDILASDEFAEYYKNRNKQL